MQIRRLSKMSWCWPASMAVGAQERCSFDGSSWESSRVMSQSVFRSFYFIDSLSLFVWRRRRLGRTESTLRLRPTSESWEASVPRPGQQDKVWVHRPPGSGATHPYHQLAILPAFCH
jgi:hypothetical protein